MKVYLRGSTNALFVAENFLVKFEVHEDEIDDMNDCDSNQRCILDKESEV